MRRNAGLRPCEFNMPRMFYSQCQAFGQVNLLWFNGRTPVRYWAVSAVQLFEGFRAANRFSHNV